LNSCRLDGEVFLGVWECALGVAFIFCECEQWKGYDILLINWHSKKFLWKTNALLKNTEKLMLDIIHIRKKQDKAVECKQV